MRPSCFYVSQRFLRPIYRERRGAKRSHTRGNIAPPDIRRAKPKAFLSRRSLTRTAAGHDSQRPVHFYMAENALASGVRPDADIIPRDYSPRMASNFLIFIPGT